MFKAKINTAALSPTIKAMASVIEEASFELNEDGLAARAVDPANACMCEITIPESAFIEFEATESEIGVDLARFMEIIGMSDKSGDISLGIDEETHKLNIVMGGLSYTMALLDPSTLRKSPQIPELELPVEIELVASKFRQAVKAAYMVGDNISIGVDGETVFMESKGDSDAVRLNLEGDDLISLKPSDVKTRFSLDYMVDMVKGFGASDNVMINLGTDMPITIDFYPYKDCCVTYVLAPRIDPA